MRGTRLRQQAPVEIHEDAQQCREDENDTAMEESRDPLEESGCTQDDSEDDDIDESVLQDIEQFQRSFKDIGKKYRLINRIGEGESANVVPRSRADNL
jgi:cell division control protein 7